MESTKGHAISPIVSIGMPVFNGEAFVAEAVQSLLGQSFQQFELVISDNASTDGTSDICERFAASDARVRYYRQEVNIGSLANFEFVFRQARGALFMWAAHDDIWSPRWVESLVSRIGDSTDTWAFGRVRHVDERLGPVLHIANDRPFDFSVPIALLRRIGFFIEPEALGKANAVYGLFPRDAVKDFLPIFLRGYGYGDCAMLWCMLSRYRLESVDNVFLYKRLHESAASAGRPANASQPVWRLYVRGLAFVAGTNLSCRGIGDYMRSDPGLTATICLLLAPVKMILSLLRLRAAARAISS